MAAPEPTLCATCRGIDVFRPYLGPYEVCYRSIHFVYRHHATLLALETAAAACHLCAMLLGDIRRGVDGGPHVVCETLFAAWHKKDSVCPFPVVGARAERNPGIEAWSARLQPAARRTANGKDVSLPVLLEIILGEHRPDWVMDVVVHWTDARPHQRACRKATTSFALLPYLPDRLAALRPTDRPMTIDRSGTESSWPEDDQDAAKRAPLGAGTGSRASLDLAHAWMTACDQGHAHCRQLGAAKAQKLPTRVLDVQEAVPVLYEAGAGVSAPYVCLSHCWGPAPPRCITTTSTLARHKAGMPLATLPPTFCDAIAVTRRLGYRYLWIDSLCILQDDDADWQREAMNMCSYYGDAALTITADAAASDDDGLFTTGRGIWASLLPLPMLDDLAGLMDVVRPDRLVLLPSGDGLDKPRPRCYLLKKNAHRQLPWKRLQHKDKRLHWLTRAVLMVKERSWYPTTSMPLHGRGWALQESLLSRRTLSFDPFEVRWNCATLAACECMPEGTLNLPRDGTYNLGRGAGRAGGSYDPERREFVYRLWTEIVQLYTGRTLTLATDVLPAIAGVAAQLSNDLGPLDNPASMYRAGLWMTNLRKSLCWYTTGRAWGGAPSAADVYLAPSWSWASVPGYHVVNSISTGLGAGSDADGPVAAMNPPANNLECDILQCWTQPPQSFGRVVYGELVLRGHLRHGWPVSLWKVGLPWPRDIHVFFDCSREWPSSAVYCMPLLLDTDSMLNHVEMVLLMLVPSAAKFRRIGIIKIYYRSPSDHKLQRFEKWLRKVRVKEVTVV